MKKILLLFVSLLLPLSVNAKSDIPNHDFIERFEYPFLSHVHNGNTYNYSFTYTYENGQYQLGDIINKTGKQIRSTYLNENANNIIYTCLSNTETTCDNLYAVHYDKAIIHESYYSAIKLENGEGLEDKWEIPVATSFHKEGNEYVLDNPENYITTGIISYDWNYIGKYFCEDRSTHCEEILYIDNMEEIGLTVYRSENDFVYGQGFDYQNGTFILKGIIDSKWPNYEEYVGTYTCMNKETSCDTLYYINRFIEPNYYTDGYLFMWIDPAHFEGTKVNNNVKEISMEKTDTKDIKEYIKNSTSVWIEDETIIKIENNEIVPLKAGKTIVLIKKDEEVILLRIEITDNESNQTIDNLINPYTGNQYYIWMILGIIISITTFMVFEKMKGKTRKH